MDKDALIIVPFHLPWDWSADYQRQTCLELSKHHTVVAYIHNDARFFLKRAPGRTFPVCSNIVFFQPRFPFPFRRFPQIEELNHLVNIAYLAWRYGRKNRQPIIWIFDALFWFYPKVRRFNSRIISLYDCVDFVWSRDKDLCIEMQTMEKKLITLVNYFFVNSSILYERHRHIRKADALVPQGFRLNDFKKPALSGTQFPIDKPIVGFIGAINHRLDFGLIARLAKRNPKIYFVLWGKIQETELIDEKITAKRVRYLDTLPNVILGYSLSTRDVPGIISQFDIGIIPYRISLLSNKYCFPMKLLEYFYMGKPVISTPIAELKMYSGVVTLAGGKDEWQTSINRIIREKWSSTKKDAQLKIALKNSWEKKVNVILKTLAVRRAVLKI